MDGWMFKLDLQWILEGISSFTSHLTGLINLQINHASWEGILPHQTNKALTSVPESDKIHSYDTRQVKRQKTQCTI